MDNQFATLFCHTFFLTYGEDLVIETARHHREFIKDPILKQQSNVVDWPSNSNLQ